MDRATRNTPQFQAPILPERLHIPSGMARVQFRAMGTTISLLLPAADCERGEALVSALFADWERTLSRFLPESELSQLNRRAGTPVVVAPLLWTVLCQALAAAQATNGLYDPTMLTQLLHIGYDRTFNELATELPPASGPALPGGRWRDIQLDEARHQVTLPPGVGVEFGGIAKGMAVDAALEELSLAGIHPALVNAGGDLAVRGVPVQEQQWSLEIPGKTGSWVIPFHHGALATSGIARRHWRQGTQERHHLIDPRTGMPADSDLWSVTVAAAHVVQAEVAAKTAFILGREQGRAFLHQHGLAGLLMQDDGAWTTAGCWPREAMVSEGKEAVPR